MVLTNRASLSCEMDGYSRLSLLSAAGRASALTYRHGGLTGSIPHDGCAAAANRASAWWQCVCVGAKASLR